MLLKRTILRYCLLSYNAVMIKISTKKTVWWKNCCCYEIYKARCYKSYKGCWCCKHYVKPVGDLNKYGLFLTGDADQFKLNGIDELKHSKSWSVPINQACTLARDGMKDDAKAKDVITAIAKFQESLENLIHFIENPFPPLCVNMVWFVSYMYVIFGSFALQQCYYREDKPSYAFLLVNSRFSFSEYR